MTDTAMIRRDDDNGERPHLFPLPAARGAPAPAPEVDERPAAPGEESDGKAGVPYPVGTPAASPLDRSQSHDRRKQFAKRVPEQAQGSPPQRHRNSASEHRRSLRSMWGEGGGNCEMTLTPISSDPIGSLTR